MRRLRTLSMLLALAVLVPALPSPLAAADSQPELQPQQLFAVQVVAGVADVTFVAAMSSIPTYPVTVMAVSGAVEELLYQGVLSEGIYRLKAPLKKVPPGPVKVVVKINLVNRSQQGSENFVIYKTWDGNFSR